MKNEVVRQGRGGEGEGLCGLGGPGTWRLAPRLRQVCARTKKELGAFFWYLRQVCAMNKKKTICRSRPLPVGAGERVQRVLRNNWIASLSLHTAFVCRQMGHGETEIGYQGWMMKDVMQARGF